MSVMVGAGVCYSPCCYTVLNCVIMCYSVSHCITRCYTVSPCFTLCYHIFSVSHGVTLCYSVLYCVTLCYTMLYCVTFCYSVLYCVTVCYSVLYLLKVCYTVLQYVTALLRRSSSEKSVINQYNENLRSIQHQEQNLGYDDHYHRDHDDNHYNYQSFGCISSFCVSRAAFALIFIIIRTLIKGSG